MREDDFGRRVQAALGFTAANRERRQEWMLDPETKGVGQVEAERTLAACWPTARGSTSAAAGGSPTPTWRSWVSSGRTMSRSTSLPRDDGAFASAPPELRTATPETRRKALRLLLDHLRQGLAITTDALDPANVEALGNASRQSLREPWSISQQETPSVAAALIIDAPKRADAGDAFGLDFAVEDPQTGLFGIGIECDAPRHELLGVARAREIWRPSVLGRAVPKLHRVPLYAWYHRGEEERARLRGAIHTALKWENAA